MQKFGGLRIPNSAVFDYPTSDALAGFVLSRLEGAAEGQAAKAEAPSESRVSPSASFIERLNSWTAGRPLFLVPGAGMQAAGFQTLAMALPVPVYGISWPRGALARERWPGTLQDFASFLVKEVRVVQAEGPYKLAGHSFGAAVVLEMAQQLEAAGEDVALVGLLDPRSLLPAQGDLGGAFGDTSMVQTLALLSQTSSEGSRFAAQLEELTKSDAEKHAEILTRNLGAAAFASLQHVHETSRWYAGLLADASREVEEVTELRVRKVVWLQAEETWLKEAANEDSAAATVRSVEAAIFQRDSVISERLAELGAAAKAAADAPRRVPGGHFAMLLAPHVSSTALWLCHALVETGAAEVS